MACKHFHSSLAMEIYRNVSWQRIREGSPFMSHHLCCHWHFACKVGFLTHNTSFAHRMIHWPLVASKVQTFAVHIGLLRTLSTKRSKSRGRSSVRFMYCLLHGPYHCSAMYVRQRFESLVQLTESPALPHQLQRIEKTTD